MIQLATEADVRRETRRRKRTYPGPGFGPRSFECLGLGLALDLGNGDAPNPFASQRGFATLFPGAYVAYHADYGWDATAHTWADQSGNGRTGTLVSTGVPTITANAIGSRNALSFGTNTCGVIWTLSLPDPSATPFYCWLAFRQVSWAFNGVIWAGTTTSAPGLLQISASPLFRMQNTVAGPLGSSALGQFVVAEASFTGSASDYIRVGTNASAAGTNCGTSHAEVTFALGKTNAGNIGAVMDILAFVVAPGAVPPANARALAKTYWPGIAA